MVVVGDHDHESTVNHVNSHFSRITRDPENGEYPLQANLDRPLFTPSCIQIRDDDVELAHLGIF